MPNVINKTACKGYVTSEHKHSTNRTEVAIEAPLSTPSWSELASTSKYTQYLLPTHTQADLERRQSSARSYS